MQQAAKSSQRDPRAQALVEHCFRTEAGRLSAVLTRFFGTAGIELAEDIVQDTLIAALDAWSVGGIPDRPAAWLMRVAKNKALNEVARQRAARRNIDVLAAGLPAAAEIDAIFLEDEIRDCQLRMIFTCCHPALSLTSQIALTLKTLCGFGVREVASALMTNDSLINKRLYRARRTLRDKRPEFAIPSGEELQQRISAVGLTLYLMFNEGYSSSRADSIIRRDMCAEAMRLCRLLQEQFHDRPDLHALFALMCLHTARFDARTDEDGGIVIFEEQDRSLWNRELIAAGMQHLERSRRGSELSAWHLEAGIAAEHCLAPSFAATNWQSIKHNYELLARLKPNPVIDLNIAIVSACTENAAAAVQRLDALERDGRLKNYYLLTAAQGIFRIKTGDILGAARYLERARGLTQSPAERRFIDKQLLLIQRQEV